MLADGFVGLSITQNLLAVNPGDLRLLVVLPDSTVHDFARTSGIPHIVFRSSIQLVEQIPTDVELGILAWWPKIVPKAVFDIPAQGFINTHPSFLPWNRGKHYNFWALVELAPFGVSLHRVTENVDAGRVIAQKSIDYDWTDNGESLYQRAQNEMTSLFLEVWPELRAGKLIEPTDKENSEPVGSVHYAEELDRASNISLDSSYLARDLLNLLRARTFPPHPGCWFEDEGEFFQVRIEIERIK